MRVRHLVVVLAAVLAGCGETVLEVGPDRSPPMVSVTGSGAACTHQWATAVDGNWDDPTRWSTGTVPTPSSIVCIEAVGTYTVTVTITPIWAHELRIGNGSSAIKFRVETGNVVVSHELYVAAGAELSTATWPFELRAETLTNDGTINHRGSFVRLLGLGTAFRNRGTLRTHGSVQVFITLSNGGDVRVEAGRIGGSQPLWFFSPTSPGSFSWTGGVLEGVVGNQSEPVVGVEGLKLEMFNAALTGLIVSRPPATGVGGVQGVVGPAVNLKIGGAGEAHFATIAGGPILNEGTISFQPSGSTVATGRIINTGTIDVGAGSGVLELRLDSLVNTGTLLIRDSTRFTDPSGILVNKGTVTAAPGASLVIAGGDFIAESPGTMSGRLILENGRLGGTGFLDRVTSVGGVVSPNSSSAVGTLLLQHLKLDAASRVVADVVLSLDGVTPYGDRIDVAGTATLAGTIEARAVSPLVPGVCGQAVRILTHASPLVGAFTNQVGFQLAPSRAWRLYDSTTVLSLAGFDPSKNLSYSPTSLALAEGGTAGTAKVCLGRSQPTATVSLAMVGRQGQVTPSPSPLNFTTANWAGPQLISVVAVNDAIAEPTHADRVGFDLTSTDPAYNGATVLNLPVTITDNDPGTDLALELVFSPATVPVGQALEPAFRITNVGPAASTASTFTVAIPGLTYIQSFGATCSTTAGLVTCSVGAIAPGAQVEFRVVVRALTAGTYANAAAIAGVEYDPVSSNNSLVWNLTIN